MSRLSETIPRDRFQDLPRRSTAAGAARRVGVEIEMTGLTEREMARIVSDAVGGTVVEDAPYEMAVEESSLGRVRCFLDTAFRKGKQHALSRLGLELGREVIPVELTTEPLSPAALPRIETLRETLRQAGAIGSREGFLLSFGLHLNVEVAAEEVSAWRPVLTAFALLEDWLRLSDPIDGSRRLLPFVDPYPHGFVRHLLSLDDAASSDQVMELYLRETPTRNRSLDMLPLFAHLDPDRVARAGLRDVAARPAYHYRLPDSRIDEPGWRIAYEWNRWTLVERVAEDADLMAELTARWRVDGEWFRRSWCEEVESILSGAGVVGAAA